MEDVVVKFDYTAEALAAIAAEASAIDMSDLEAVKETHKKLVTVRTTITKKGKELRENAIKFQKEVIEKEKEYLGITSGIEEGLKTIIDAEKERVIIEARKDMLPQKRQQLSLLTYKQEVSDEAILAMDDAQWVAYYQEAMSFDQKEKQRVLDEAEAEKTRGEREARIREEERERLEAEAARKKEEESREAEREAARQKAQEEEEKKKREADQIYQKFLLDNNYNEVTDRVVEKDGVVRIYRLVAEFNRISL